MMTQKKLHWEVKRSPQEIRVVRELLEILEAPEI